MIGDFFTSEMDEAAINAAGVKPLQPELVRLTATKTHADVLTALARLQSFGIGVGFRFGSSPDLKQSELEMAVLGQGGLGLPERGYYFNDDEKSLKIRQQYVAHIANLFVLLGEARDSATVSAQAVMALETKLALNSLARVQLRDPYRSYHKMKLADVVAKHPGIDLKGFLAARGAPAFEDINLAHPRQTETGRAAAGRCAPITMFGSPPGARSGPAGAGRRRHCSQWAGRGRAAWFRRTHRPRPLRSAFRAANSRAAHASRR